MMRYILYWLNSMNLSCRIVFYNGCINSVLIYLAAIWGNITKTNLNRLQRLQNLAIKNIFNLPYETTSKSSYENYPIMTISKLLK